MCPTIAPVHVLSMALRFCKAWKENTIFRESSPSSLFSLQIDRQRSGEKHFWLLKKLTLAEKCMWWNNGSLNQYHRKPLPLAAPRWMRWNPIPDNLFYLLGSSADVVQSNEYRIPVCKRTAEHSAANCNTKYANMFYLFFWTTERNSLFPKFQRKPRPKDAIPK